MSTVSDFDAISRFAEELLADVESGNASWLSVEETLENIINLCSYAKGKIARNS